MESTANHTLHTKVILRICKSKPFDLFFSLNFLKSHPKGVSLVLHPKKREIYLSVTHYIDFSS